MQLQETIAKIRAIQIELAEKTSLQFKRYLFSQLNPRNRLNILVGARGVGKTTLLLQKYRDKLLYGNDALYFSADSAFVTPFTLLQIGEQFYQQGGKYLIIDEIHHYSNWQAEVKTMYDSFPDLRLVLTGSSSLNITFSQFDLSRRSRIYQLWGLSFREFVNLAIKNNLPPFPLDILFSQHEQKALTIKRETEASKQKILALFQEYLTFGYYPYFLEGKEDFSAKLENSLDKVLYEDIPVQFSTIAGSIVKLKKLLTLIATSSPFTINIERLSRALSASKSTVYTYLDILDKASLILPLQQQGKGYVRARKPAKVYLENPNLYPLLAGEKEIRPLVGALRECFLANQLGKVGKLSLGKQVDFIVDSRRIEVGGRSKDSTAADIWIGKDGIEVGSKHVIPLYLFGFLY